MKSQKTDNRNLNVPFYRSDDVPVSLPGDSAQSDVASASHYWTKVIHVPWFREYYSPLYSLQMPYLMDASITPQDLWDLINDKDENFPYKIRPADREALILMIRRAMAEVDADALKQLPEQTKPRKSQPPAAKQGLPLPQDDTKRLYIQVGESLAEFEVDLTAEWEEEFTSAWEGPWETYESLKQFLKESGYDFQRQILQ